MDTNTMMASLREMVRAEAQTIVLEMLHAERAEGEIEKFRLNYSKHETVVREQLQEMGKQIAELNKRTCKQRRLGGN